MKSVHILSFTAIGTHIDIVLDDGVTARFSHSTLTIDSGPLAGDWRSGDAAGWCFSSSSDEKTNHDAYMLAKEAAGPHAMYQDIIAVAGKPIPVRCIYLSFNERAGYLPGVGIDNGVYRACEPEEYLRDSDPRCFVRPIGRGDSLEQAARADEGRRFAQILRDERRLR